ncbi:hypothetical protein Tco_0128036 [Tanacetum coccineum]
MVGHCASRGRGRGNGGSVNESSGSGMGTSGGGTRDSGTSSRGGGTSSRGRGRGRRGGGTTSSGGRRGGGRGSRGVGSTRGSGMAGSSGMDILTAEEEYQLELDEETFRECIEEQAREQSKIELTKRTKYAERSFIPSIHHQPTQQFGVWVKDTTDVTFEDIDEASEQTGKTKGPPSHVDGIRIYHKNRGTSKRIANMKLKKPFQFDKHGTCSTPEKAFDVDD